MVVEQDCKKDLYKMAEFSAHRVRIETTDADTAKVLIANPINLYVSPGGDDLLNTGLEPLSPFRTPERALNWLDDKVISESGFVTINFSAGIYDIENQIDFTHPQGERVALIGAEPEIFAIRRVDSYRTFGFTFGNPYYGYYSGVTHEINLFVVAPQDATPLFSDVNRVVYNAQGYGVVIEDYDLVYNDSYNPAYFYASYPNDPRNNIVRQAALLGAHSLIGVSAGSSGSLKIVSSIRDDWIHIGAGAGPVSYGRYYGNPQINSVFPAGVCAAPQDADVTVTNQWLLRSASAAGAAYRGLYMTGTPVGFYGTTATSGIASATASLNFVKGYFPNNSFNVPTAWAYGGVGLTLYWSGTGSIQVNDAFASTPNQWYTATGPDGTVLNDGFIRGFNNYHQYSENLGYTLISPTITPGGGRTVNTNRITLKILPTVFRRFGNILNIKSSGLRKIKNIFFDGRQMLYHYALLSESSGQRNNTSNKYALNCIASDLGYEVEGEPAGLGIGLMNNVGIKDFHCAILLSDGTRCNLGVAVMSNCSHGIIARNKSVVRTFGSVCTGMGGVGIASSNSSVVSAERCFTGWNGSSMMVFRFSGGSTLQFGDQSFILGQTFNIPGTVLRGTVWDWESRSKTLSVVVRKGVAESLDPFGVT